MGRPAAREFDHGKETDMTRNSFLQPDHILHHPRFTPTAFPDPPSHPPPPYTRRGAETWSRTERSAAHAIPNLATTHNLHIITSSLIGNKD